MDGSRDSLVISGGLVVTATDEYLADVRIAGGVIAEITPPGRLRGAGDVIDAGGCMVLPGGIDTHTHFENPTLMFTTASIDDFHSGTVAAAYGGTTTIVDFVKTEPDSTITACFERRREVAASKVVVDFALHPVVPIAAAETGALAELADLAVRHGAMTWKFFMAYPGSLMVDDRTLIEGMRLAAQVGALPILHAENGHIVHDATQRLIEGGLTAEHHHHDAHPHVAEAEAVYRAISIGEYTGSPVFIVHVSSARAAEEIARAKRKGQPVYAETCPQYLLTSYEEYEGAGFPAAAYICSPPIREQANQAALWRALELGELDTIATDHAPFSMCEEACFPPQKSNGKDYFPHIPNGVPGVEERLMLMWEAGVRTGRLTRQQFVNLTATRPAKLFGLHPRKGSVAVGADADIVVWDPNAPRTLHAADLHTQAGYTLYEGMDVSATPRWVLSRGEVLVGPDRTSFTAGRGTYLHRTSAGRP
jgi:dihydropyrimidinase